MAKSVSIDWITIEGQYRANLTSIRAIARAHNVSEGGIRNRAKDYKWVRDPSSTKREVVRAAMAGHSPESDSSQNSDPASGCEEPAQTVAVERVRVQARVARSRRPRNGNAATARTIAEAALEDIRDMRAGLHNARIALDIAGDYLDTQFNVNPETGKMVDPRFLKAVMDASAAAIDQIRKIRDLDSKIPDEMEALKLLVSSGWIPDELLVSAFQEYRAIKPSMKNVFQQHFQSSNSASAADDED